MRMARTARPPTTPPAIAPALLDGVEVMLAFEFAPEAGILDDGAVEVGAVEVGAVEVGAVEVGAVEVGAVEVGAVEVGVIEDVPALLLPEFSRSARGLRGKRGRTNH
jgi:hypothetical protein